VAEPDVEKRVTWGELFFDLVFVFAVTEVSALLRHDHSWAGLVRALVLFVPIYWAWVGTSIHSNTHDVDTARDRLGIFTVGLFSLFMALGVQHAYDERGLLFGGSYLAIRIVLAVLVFRGTVFRHMRVNSFSVGVLVTGPLLLAGGLIHGGWRVGLWAVAALVDLAVPAVVRRRLGQIRFNAEHLPERFGLFLIIALGESIVAVGVSAEPDPQSPARLAAVATAFALACALWWVYFVFAVRAVRYAVATAEVQTTIVRQVLSYSHLGFIAGVIGVAVGLSEVVGHPTVPLRLDVAALLIGGCAVYLAIFGYTRWRMFHLVSWTRLGGAGASLLVLPFARAVPALVVLLWLVVAVAGVNLVEAHLNRRASRASEPGSPAGTAGRPGNSTAPAGRSLRRRTRPRAPRRGARRTPPA
jgi:low temperature requirement protein LtrA